MFKKLDKRGFTLAELLIVVAIIGVLVAISIPIFTSQLEKAREATDLANIRSAYAAAQTAALTGMISETEAVDKTKSYQYDTTTGTLVVGTSSNWFQGTSSGNADDDVTIGSMTYDRATAYKSLTITFSGEKEPYEVSYTLGTS